MSDQVAPGGAGWNVRSSAPAGAPPVQPSASTVPAASAADFVPRTLNAPMPAGGAWVAGVGWVPGHHADGGARAKAATPRRRRKGMLGFGPTSVGGILALRIGGSAAVGLVLFSLFGWHSWVTGLFHSHHDVTTPSSIAGDPLVIEGPLASISRQVTSDLSTDSIVVHAAGGFYAPPGAKTPSYIVFAVKHNGASVSSGAMSDIIDQASGGKFTSTGQTDTRDGVTYSCGNVAVGTRLGTACLWDDYDVGGFLVSFEDSDVPAVMQLTQLARNAIEVSGSAASSSKSS